MSAPNEVRRRDLAMDEAGIEALLQRGFCGRLATVGIDGAPYCTTLLYVWMDGRIHMHGTGARGHLRANIEHEARACFAIDEPGEVFDYGRFECDSTVSYASVVAFGRVTVVDDVGDQAALLRGADGQVPYRRRAAAEGFLPAHRPDRALPARDRPHHAASRSSCPTSPGSGRRSTAARRRTRGRLIDGQRPFQLGLRFSAKAFGPSTVSSLLVMATKAG